MSKVKRFGWYLGVAFSDWLHMWIHWSIIRGLFVHAPVWVQMQMLFQRRHFAVVLGGVRSLVPHEKICKEATCSPWPGLGTVPTFPASFSPERENPKKLELLQDRWSSSVFSSKLARGCRSYLSGKLSLLLLSLGTCQATGWSSFESSSSMMKVAHGEFVCLHRMVVLLHQNLQKKWNG
jgi:hypothetical protein